MKFLSRCVQLAISMSLLSTGGTNNPANNLHEDLAPGDEISNEHYIYVDIINNVTNIQLSVTESSERAHFVSKNHIEYNKAYSIEDNEIKVQFRDNSSHNEHDEDNRTYTHEYNGMPLEMAYEDDDNQIILDQEDLINFEKDAMSTDTIQGKYRDSFKSEDTEGNYSKNSILLKKIPHQYDDYDPSLGEKEATDDFWITTTTEYEDIKYNDTLESNHLLLDADNDTISWGGNFPSLWNEVMRSIDGDDDMTLIWNTQITSLWNEASSEWTYKSLIELQKQLYGLWNNILGTLDEHPKVPRWNETMITLWDHSMKKRLSKIQDNMKENYLEDDIIIIQLEQGAISAKKETVDKERFFYSFKGIPFAMPPTKHLRLKDPVPAPPWMGIRDGSIDASQCPQMEFYITIGNEDCLYLNIYTANPFSSGLPVMVWIHGGNFILGGAQEFSPLPLLLKDIVLVVIQYRLGTLGFLSTEDEVLPGNLGLKDQSLALQWVHNNIDNFGGDPRKITLSGEGAGAASSHFHIFSPKSKGLFKKVILQSGSALSQWAMRTDHKKVAKAIGTKYNCTKEEDFSSSALLKCLQDLPLHDLVEIPSLFTMIVSLPLVMTPRVDGEFLLDNPATLLREGEYYPVDIISGVNMHEGATVALPFVLNPWLAKELIDNFAIAGPALMALGREDHPITLAQSIYNHYLGNQNISWEVVNETVKMISDLSYKWPHEEVTYFHSAQALENTKTFAYELQYSGQHSFADLYGPEAGDNWITNADDLPYIFNYTMITLKQPEDLRVRELMVNLWTNFVLYGDPTPDDSLGIKWLPRTPNNLNFLAINSVPIMHKDNRNDTLKFWHSLPIQTNKLLHQEYYGPQIELDYDE